MYRQAPTHGTLARYQWRRAPCHCDRCRAANAARVAEWRRRRADRAHQTVLARAQRAWHEPTLL
jgi:hypothetical protein